ncbi:MAG: C_GCAxxG_C_C family protein [Synergistaceae bacterium]|nr:C-GCAxxG-C-C family protein [Synergistota bacterium]NLM71567.1 C_GCAxxG_C_C family protein [Synergistaceae bacterium]
MSDFDLDELQIELLSFEGKGYHCSQILLLMALRQTGAEHDASLIRATGGLSLGLGHSNATCGALLGGACLLGYYAGKGADGETEHPMFRMMVRRLVEWFRDELCAGESIMCGDILDKHGRARCGLLVRSVWVKSMELLMEGGIDPTDAPPAFDNSII